MKRSHRIARILSFLILGLSPACRLHEVPDAVQPPIQMPDAFSVKMSSEARDEPWWKLFQDQRLDALLEDVLTHNLDLKSAWARLDQSLAAQGIAGSALWPSLDAKAGVRGSRANLSLQGQNITTEQVRFSLGLAAAYEIDLWGRLASLDDAALLDIQASRDDLETLAMSLAAMSAQVWFEMVEQRAQKSLLEHQVGVNETFLELVELRFGQGLASALDVYQQRQSVVGSRARLPLIESRIATLEHQLSVLKGRPPERSTSTLPQELPQLPSLPPTGIPADLMQRRPDIRAAHRRVLAADHRVAAAVANRFPSLRLTGDIGFDANAAEDLFSNWVGNLAGALLGPLFDGGRRAAEVDRQKAKTEELLNRYGQTVLVALREVEDALIQESKLRAHLTELEAQTVVAQATLREAQARYMGGLIDYLPVLTAIRSLQSTEQDALAARRSMIFQRIQLCLALGGAWTSGLRKTVPEEEVSSTTKAPSSGDKS